MPDRIKVMPGTPDAVGMMHPIDGALGANGSLWSHDDFTQRRFFDGSILRFETAVVETPAAEKPADTPPAKSVKAAKAVEPS